MVQTRRQSMLTPRGSSVDSGNEPQTFFWGLFLYSLSTAFGASTSVIVKLLGGVHGMPAMQLVFVRSCILVACTLPHLRHPAARKLIAERHDMLFLRGCLGFVSVALIYCAVRLLPLSDAVALAFLAPVLVAALSPLLLQERPPRSVVVALALAAIGALVVASPASLGGPSSLAAASPARRLGVAAALGHAVTAAGARITVRSLGIGSRSAHVGGVIVLSAGCVSAAAAGLVCLLQSSFVLPQQPAHWALMAAVGVAGYLHQTTMTAGLQRVPVSTASSLTYLSIVWSLLADWLLFKHPPSGTSLAGAALICGGGLLVALWRMRSGFDHGGGGAGRSPNKEQLSKEQLSVLRM
ncbi:hypothetical protein D9Q98_003267 [Chlorella vulgaris]|uniref:EamA domain-containing protein n=1 Tax=Chlorella vulgaris TaxID=3077 RepID=A0A9D4TS73_CHLVU|nr:hypothetical protein D9Q98_003267 [Chlorella vulgaris]